MQKLILRFLLVIALLTAFLVYRPGLNGPFVFDDGINITGNQHLRLHDLSLASLSEAAFSVPGGPLQRPLSMLSFSLNFYIDADKVSPFTAPFPFKLTNLIIHLLNGVVVFVLTRLLLGFCRERHQPHLPPAYPEWLALAVSAAWLLHPLNLTSVLYVVQRMTSLSALFTFAGLTLYLFGRIRLFRGQRGGMATILISLLVFTPLALLSKENGALLPFFMLSAELTLFKFETANPNTRRALILFFIVSVMLPILAGIAYLAMHPDWLLAGYINRDFTLSERLMTEARAIWFYLRLITLPSTALMGLYHDDFAVSHQLFNPATTLPAILGVFALVAGIWLLRRRMPLVAFGILFFLVGQSMESSIFALELVHEHRNYLPMYGILLCFFHILLDPHLAPTTRLPRRILVILLITIFAAGTLSRANSWGNSFDLWSMDVEHHPTSARTNIEMGDFYANFRTGDPVTMETNHLLARNYYEQATALEKNNPNGLFGLIRLNATQGKPVEQSWLDELKYRLGNEAMPSNVNDQLIALVNCRMRDSCTLTAVQIESLLHAPLVNPKISGRAKALAYSALTYYLVHVTRDYPAALETTYRSIELSPQELEYRLSLVTILIAMQHFEQAREQITLLKQLDRKGIRARETALLQKQLQEDN